MKEDTYEWAHAWTVIQSAAHGFLTLLTWTPRLLWTPLHSIQTTAPKLREAQSGLAFPQSAQTGLASRSLGTRGFLTFPELFSSNRPPESPSFSSSKNIDSVDVSGPELTLEELRPSILLLGLVLLLVISILSGGRLPWVNCCSMHARIPPTHIL